MNKHSYLFDLRTAKALSLTEMAKAIGVARSTYCRWEAKENKPDTRIEYLQALAKLEGLNAESIKSLESVKSRLLMEF